MDAQGIEAGIGHSVTVHEVNPFAETEMRGLLSRLDGHDVPSVMPSDMEKARAWIADKYRLRGDAPWFASRRKAAANERHRRWRSGSAGRSATGRITRYRSEVCVS
jgi:hypothetical protein